MVRGKVPLVFDAERGRKGKRGGTLAVSKLKLLSGRLRGKLKSVKRRHSETKEKIRDGTQGNEKKKG